MWLRIRTYIRVTPFHQRIRDWKFKVSQNVALIKSLQIVKNPKSLFWCYEKVKV